MTFITVIFAIAILVAIVVVIPVFGSYGKKNPKSRVSRKHAVSIDRNEIKRKWDELAATARLGGAAQLKSAILDADKLTEKVLLNSGYRGNTFAECLKSAKSRFSNYSDYDNLWYAHKVRNSIAHDNGLDFNANSAKKAILYYEKALKILGAL